MVEVQLSSLAQSTHMGETRKPLSFGPSERYLPAKKLQVGDVLTLNIVDYVPDQVDTEWGSKWQLHINILSSSTDVVEPGKMIWRTVANAPVRVIQYLKENKVPGEDYEKWVFRIIVQEHGIQMDEVA